MSDPRPEQSPKPDGGGPERGAALQGELVHAHLAAIVESSDDAIVSKTLQGIVTSWNAGAARIFGYQPDEIVGKSITTIIPPELRHEEDEILAKISRGQPIEHYDTVRMTKDGRRINISLTISPIRNTKGTIVGASKIARDITRRKQIEQALQEEAEALETLNRVGRVVAAELDLQRLVQAVTDAATQLTGAAYGAFFYNVRSESGEAYWLYALSGAPREAFAQFPMPRNTAVFGPTFTGTGIVRSPDITADPRYGLSEPFRGMPPGHLPVRSYLAAPVISRSGEVLGGLFFGHPQPDIFSARAERLLSGIASQAAVAIDNARLFQAAQREITARSAVEAALRESESRFRTLAAEREQLLDSERAARSEAERLGHLKDEFLATLSHELRTPLNAIQGWGELLKNPNLTPQDRARGIETIERNARAQAQIINDLMDMSRIVSGKIHLEVQPVNLQRLIHAAIESVRPSADAKRIRIQTMLDASIGLTRGDPNRLQQVLWNLLTNAVKFTPKGGHVQVVMERVNSHVEILVEDNGIGIKPEFLPYVFDRFRQADPSTTRRYGGLGLGLSITKSLVELHGGSVRVKSPGDGQGSTFVVALPVSVVRADDIDRQKASETASDLDLIELPRLSGATVLLVDDEADARVLMSRLLEDRQARVVQADSAAEALELLRRESIDIVISDIGMPDMDGYELVKQIRVWEQTAQQKRIPAIAVTAYARSEDRQRSLLAGYQMHISKPIEARELIAGIASLLNISR